MKLLALMKKEFLRFFGDPKLLITMILPGVLIYLIYTIMGSAIFGGSETAQYDFKGYVSGESQAVQSPAATVPEAQTGSESTGQGGDRLGSENNTAAATYVLNTNSMKFHYANCRYASKISPENYRTCSSREEAIAQGFIPCGVCNP